MPGYNVPVSMGREDSHLRGERRSRYSGSTYSSDPDQIAANITRSQWQHFLDTYRPVEEDVLAKAMQTDFTAEGDEAGATAMAGVRASRGTLARSLSRSGAKLTGEERSAVGRRQNLALAKAAGQAENTTRRTLSDSRTDMLSAITQIGRGVATTASSGMQSVAGMAAQREQQYKAAKAQQSATNLSAAATAASLLIYAI